MPAFAIFSIYKILFYFFAHFLLAESDRLFINNKVKVHQQTKPHGQIMENLLTRRKNKMKVKSN